MVDNGVSTTHVLVIGSGGAGVRAAIEAAEHGPVVLLSKTIAGKGGCTPMAEGGYNAVLREGDSPELHVADTLRGGAYLNDPALVDALVREAPDRVRELVSWGAVFDVGPEGGVAQRPFGGQQFPRTCYAGDRTGHEMMVTLMDRLAATGVTVVHESAAVELLLDDGRCAGAVALDGDGAAGVYLADAVVMATGGGTQVYDISTNSSSGTGDGYALGYRAGAELIDMEMVQFHPTGAIHPYDARGRLVTEAVRGEGGRLLNRLGERFMARYDPERMELSTRDVVARAIATEVLEGRGTERGGVWLDVTHLSARQVEERLPIMLEQFLAFGVDIRTEPMEVAPTAHHIMGGLRITPDCATTLPGLFACGECSGGVHGANRLGGNALAETQVFGRRAGLSAGRSPVREKGVTPGIDRQLGALRRRFDGFRDGEVPPASVVRRLKETMWCGAGIYRDRGQLAGALAGIEVLKHERLLARTDRNLLDCCTAANMLLTAELICRAALLRPECRGAHTRLDPSCELPPDRSPYAHTYLSTAGEGIEEVAR
ncbi:MAG: fumarate reductase subunit A [Methanospirillum sp.]|nr:fumarate reductase subunit A [Methanospirillum sp.]